MATSDDAEGEASGGLMHPRVSFEDLLGAVADVAAGLELPRTLRRIITVATSLVDARYGALGVVGPDQTIQEFIVEGMDPEQVAAIGDLPHGDGILGLLIREPQPIRLKDLHRHPSSVGFPPGHPSMTTFVGVPIRVRDRVFGNLYLTEKRTGGEFTPEDERLLMLLAAAAGVAIENANLYAQVQHRSDWLRASAVVATAALSGQSTSEVLNQMVAEARRAAGCDLVMVATTQDGGPMLVEFVSGSDEDVHTWVGRPVATRDGGTASVFPAMSLVLPLSTGSKEAGLLVLANTVDVQGFSDAECRLVEDYARQAGLALELAAERVEHERLALLEDRDRIGRDLHDLVIQRLFATGMMLQGAQRLATNPEVFDRIGRAVEELDQTILEVRSTIFALHESREGEGGGLRAQVLRELASGAAALGFEPTVRFDGPIDSTVPESVAEHVVAALREALSNAARHAHATSVRVSLSVESGEVVLIVTDNGHGPDPSSTRRSGLANLDSRATTLGGRTSVEPIALDSESTEVAGTRLVWRAPIG